MASAARRHHDPVARATFPRLALLLGGAEAGAQDERRVPTPSAACSAGG